ncbi:hypothetical protein BCV69DRAFT_279751 [Microstroma glucosiphilum]|uniref:Zn(2)-C6 fungal-type domain-containing protein n=1 Tax=Pseudomicrostroma glucosiphilum TaxID=1684307 RepID=A0A316UF57_9BASI|nr:hypothetical protein BCV69DRAFT_279751 [Pseudomicrostroma glucosiphilum]PWN23840.1 hypothetical protein BCV69DRAFT_279751 [Pseudomicrostroma glucosiphilum]
MMIPGGQGSLQGIGRPASGQTARNGQMGPESSPAGSGGKYTCPNCSKSFARDDLLRRHLAREARAMAQPQVDRQKSCQECARSKARCDLEVPSCGRCRSRNKHCTYGARSGNPNVRRHRESIAPTGNMAGMNIAGGSTYGGGWGSGESSYQGSEGPPDSRPQMVSTDDSSSESSFGWSDPNTSQNNNMSGNSYLPQRTYSTASMSSIASHNAAPPLPQPHSQHPQHYGQYQLDTNPAVTPTTYMRHALEQSYGGMSSMGARPTANLLMTDLDRNAPGLKAEEGEETPVGRLIGSFGAGSAPLDASRNFQRMVTSPGGGISGGHPEMWNNVAAPALPNQQHYVSQTGERMGPPSLPFSNARNVPNLLSPSRGPDRQRPQPHKLLTGANMPQPPRPDLGGAGAHILSGRPLFSAIMDLSGWLEEPVVPSPLYPSGPSLASLGLGAVPGLASAMPNSDQPSMALDSPMGGSSEAGMQQGQKEPQQLPQPSTMPASRYWWANPPSQMDVALMQSVAQATATHLSHYPHLMVLPDPSSPVPPTVHRPWMAYVRGDLPASLAIARVVLAGYAVRLPASEHIVWESVARETRRLIQSHEAICNHSSNLDVLGATEALFLYCILLLMCTDPGASPYVDMSLTNTAFFALSQLAKTLSVRLQMAQQERARRKSMGEDGPEEGQGTQQQQKQHWLSWGFEETMRRTLWASYAILVLQRFRDGAVLSEGHLAGLDLILDIQLPAIAAEFEAASEEEWRQVRKQALASLSEKSGEAGSSSGEAGSTPSGQGNSNGGLGANEEKPMTFSDLTFRDLIRYRPVPEARRNSSGAASEAGGAGTGASGAGAGNDGAKRGSTASSTSGGAGAGTTTTASSNRPSSSPPPPPKALLEYFERHDAFVATVLSIAFCLDSGLSV